MIPKRLKDKWDKTINLTRDIDECFDWGLENQIKFCGSTLIENIQGQLKNIRRLENLYEEIIVWLKDHKEDL